MPIEVRELIITGVVLQEGSEGSTPAATHGGINGSEPQEEIIKMCAEKVLQLLKDKNER